MNIDSIYVSCYQYDLRLAKILVASIRDWYEDIPIALIKDVRYGSFDTSELEDAYNVSVFKAGVFGWGFGKLEPLFLPERKKFLILDADTLMVGPILEDLTKFDDDFIVSGEEPPPDFVTQAYFDLSLLSKIDSEFKFPGFTFNTGQVVATSGILKRKDFEPYVDWAPIPHVLQADIFKCGEQGLLNYMLMKKSSEGVLSLKRSHFMNLPDDPSLNVRQEIIAQGNYKFIIHWCSKRGDLAIPRLTETPRSDLLLHFEQRYYQKIFLGKIKCWLGNQTNYWVTVTKRLVKKFLGYEGAL